VFVLLFQNVVKPLICDYSSNPVSCLLGKALTKLQSAVPPPQASEIRRFVVDGFVFGEHQETSWAKHPQASFILGQFFRRKLILKLFL
jgi:hypothetical protein